MDCCGGGTVLLYSCSGAADVGCIADKVARILSKEKVGRMTCLAGVGARLSGFIASAQGADRNIVIDGCPVACAQKGLEAIGVTPEVYNLANYGCKKGETPVNEEFIEEIALRIKEDINCQSVSARIIEEDEGSGGCSCGNC
ncbi:MAG: putative zinc-binding protein [Spirochaetota bacterium]